MRGINRIAQRHQFRERKHRFVRGDSSSTLDLIKGVARLGQRQQSVLENYFAHEEPAAILRSAAFTNSQKGIRKTSPFVHTYRYVWEVPSETRSERLNQENDGSNEINQIRIQQNELQYLCTHPTAFKLEHWPYSTASLFCCGGSPTCKAPALGVPGRPLLLAHSTPFSLSRMNNVALVADKKAAASSTTASISPTTCIKCINASINQCVRSGQVRSEQAPRRSVAIIG